MRGVPPFGPGFMPARGVAGRLRDRLVAAISDRSFQTGSPSMNAHRAALGLPPVRSLWEMMNRADRELILTGLVQRILDAISAMQVRGFVTLGPTLDPTQFSAPLNARVVVSAPHRKVLPNASVMIAHAGTAR